MPKPPQIAPPTLPGAPASPQVAESPQGQKPKRKSMQPSFLGSDATANPAGGGAGKTFLGQ